MARSNLRPPHYQPSGFCWDDAVLAVIGPRALRHAEVLPGFKWRDY